MTSEKLYYNDSYIQVFHAQVKKCTPIEEGCYAVVLDRTVFYPESGGQPADTGVFDHIPVIDVQEEDNQIVHILEKCPECDDVNGRIDWARRFDHMQQHSGQHVLSGAFYRFIGAQTVGFHMGTYSSHIDLAIDELKPEDSEAVEKLANSAVFDNAPVKIHFVDKDNIHKFNVRKMPSKAFESIRLIQIDDIDCCPCGGTHVARTGEIGLIKIRSWERKNNAIRVDFVCGNRALFDYQQKNATVHRLSAALSIPIDGIEEAVDRLNTKLDQREKQATALREDFYRQLASNLRMQADYSGSTVLVTHSLSDTSATDVSLLAKSIADQPQTIALVGGVNREQAKAYLVFACSPDVELNMAEHLKGVLPIIVGKGGGGARFAQGGGNRPEAVNQALTQAQQRVAALIC